MVEVPGLPMPNHAATAACSPGSLPATAGESSAAHQALLARLAHALQSADVWKRTHPGAEGTGFVQTNPTRMEEPVWAEQI